MRDLEIRGAGNLLGPEQSGHITAVGFELYCQLLKQSVAVLKGEKVKPRVEVAVRLDFIALSPEQTDRPEKPAVARRKRKTPEISVPRDDDAWEYWDETVPEATEEANTCPVAPAYLPLDYINDSRHRIDIYRKLAQATTYAGLDQLKEELRDRFGKLPAAVELLLLIGDLKIISAEKLVTSIEVEADRLKLTRNNDYISLGGKFPDDWVRSRNYCSHFEDTSGQRPLDLHATGCEIKRARWQRTNPSRKSSHVRNNATWTLRSVF